MEVWYIRKLYIVLQELIFVPKSTVNILSKFCLCSAKLFTSFHILFYILKNLLENEPVENYIKFKHTYKLSDLKS